MFTWLSLVMSLMVSFVLSFFQLDVLDEIWDLTDSVSEGFSTYFSCFCYSIQFTMQNIEQCCLKKCFNTDRSKGIFVRENLKK